MHLYIYSDIYTELFYTSGFSLLRHPGNAFSRGSTYCWVSQKYLFFGMLCTRKSPYLTEKNCDSMRDLDGIDKLQREFERFYFWIVTCTYLYIV